MLIFIIGLIVWGFIVGALARLSLPGPDPMPWYATIGLGLGGSIIGGILARLLIGTAGGLIFAFLGAVLLLYLYRRFVQGRGARRLRRGTLYLCRRAHSHRLCPSRAAPPRRLARPCLRWKWPPTWWTPSHCARRSRRSSASACSTLCTLPLACPRCASDGVSAADVEVSLTSRSLPRTSRRSR